MWEKLSLSSNPGDFKGTTFKKFTNFIYGISKKN
jgi:hypothetical protein